MTTSTDLEASALWDQIQNLLSNDCRVRLDSSAKLINRLQAKIQQAPNPGLMKLPSSIYLPSPINGEEGAWIMRAIDLLRKIGEMTTPVAVNSMS